MDQVSDDIRAGFQIIEDHGGQVLNVFKVLANSPVVGGNVMKLITSFITNGSLSPNLRELVILRVADLSRANYIRTQHVPIGLLAGLTQDQLDMLNQWKDSTAFSDQERAVLQYIDEVAQEIRVSEETFNAVKDIFTEEQVVELTILIGCYGMIARILEALDVELEDNMDRDHNTDAYLSAADEFKQ
jgi:alkylhydroperoxidase family enzyme